MNVTQQGIITLLKSALTGKKLPLPEGFALEDADPIIRRQSLLPLVYLGADNCGISPETDLMKRYQALYYKEMIRSERQQRALEELFQHFEENGIDYLPLKGSNLKKLYPQPELRVMGDADILIRMEQYGKIRELLSALGFQEKGEYYHELTWFREDLLLELHKYLFGSVEADFYAALGDGWSMAAENEGYRYSMSQEDTFLFLFTHIVKHYRSSGIGARHFLDLYVYRQANPDLNEARLCAKLESLQLLEFYQNTCNLLAVWFDGGPADAKTETMTDFIFSGGNWGNRETYFTSMQFQEGKGRNIRFAAVWRALFPTKEQMRYRYRVLIRCPWLYPLFWPVRWAQLLLRQPGQIIKKLRLLRTLKDERVLTYYNGLRFVGLGHYYDREHQPQPEHDGGAEA